MPAIIIATANDKESTLYVDTEAKKIQHLLNRLPNKNYEIRLLPGITTSELTQELAEIDTDIEILHYSGHATPGSLLFTDQDADASKMAERLKLCPNLKLVFLNGCQTQAQAQFFIDAGISYVIATPVSIRDDEAQWVANKFYSYFMIKENDVVQAFEKTKLDARLEEKNCDLNTTRGLSINSIEQYDFNWGIFIAENAKPYYLPVSAYQLQEVEAVEHDSFIKKLLLLLENYQSPLNDSYKETIEVIKNFGEVDKETAFTDLQKILPYPVGIRLRQIYAASFKMAEYKGQYYRELLHDYACFFESLLHYSFALIIGRLWENSKLIFPDVNAEDLSLLHKFICSNRLAGDLEDYSKALLSAHNIANTAKIPTPIPQIIASFDWFAGEEFREICRFFDIQKNFFRSKIRIDDKEAVQYCYQSQRYIERAFSYFGFIIENVLASIRHINVINFRYVKQTYDTEVWSLVASEDGARRQRPFDKPIENKSVLCFSGRDFNADSPSLNLFPFYIDRSSFSRQVGGTLDLYQYAGFFYDNWINERSTQSVGYPCHYFISLKNPDRIWRFDSKNFTNATTAHIDEPVEDSQREGQKLVLAGELNRYIEQFRLFINF